MGNLSDGTSIYTGSALLGKLIGANMNVTTDQAVTITTAATKFTITKIVVTNASLSLTLAAGGFYSAAAKGGSAIVAAAQTYSALTAATKVLNPAVAISDTFLVASVPSVFLSLTTAQGAAATADIYIFGDIL